MSELAIFNGLKLNKPPEGTYNTNDLPHLNGKQLIAEFPNGFGASIVISRMSYGHEQGLYELAVLHEDGKNSQLCYATPVTGDVIGWRTPEQIIALLHDIAKLEPDLNCSHERPDDFDHFERDVDAGRPDLIDALRTMGEG